MTRNWQSKAVVCPICSNWKRSKTGKTHADHIFSTHFLAEHSIVRNGKTAPVFHPEFGRFMLETTPGKPWGIEFKDLLDVERDMKWR